MTIQRLRRFLSFVLARRTARRFVPSLLLLILLVIGLPAISGAQQTCQPDGDVDRTGTVTAADALLVFRQALDLVQLDTCQQTIADVYPQPAAPDGNITASDALCIFQKALGLPSCLGTSPPSNQPPVADAGLDQLVYENEVVTLAGSGSDADGDIVSYLWEQTGGPDVVLSDAETATASFTAPEVSTDETLRFQLTVMDDEGASITSDELTVTVRQVENQLPVVDVSVTVTARSKIDVAQYLTGPVEDGWAPGLLAAVIDEEGVRAIGAAGVRKRGSPEKFTVNDLVHVGSNTKAMTSTMLAVLVEDGVFPRGWKTTIVDVFPELLGEIDPDYHAVDLFRLVRMTGGIRPNAADWWAHQEQPNIIERRYAILRDNLMEPPAGPMGKFLYSNLGYMIAGAMAERRTGESWEVLMEEHLFAPLGITTAGFGPPGTPGAVDQPWGHYWSELGILTPIQFDNPEAFGPAGTVHISIADWAKFIALWFPNQTPAILDRASLNELLVPDSGDYAAGWYVLQREWAGRIALHHAGSNTIWRTILWIAPDRDIAYIAAANASDVLIHDTIFWVLDAIVGSLIDETLSDQPVVDVGPALFADEGDTVYLSGLAEDPDGDIVSYLWEQTGGADVVLSDAETATASFTAPKVSMDQALTFHLTVTDDAGAGVTSDELTVTIRQVENQLPVVDVGPALFADEGDTVYLSGLAEDPDGDIVSYLWEQTGGADVVLSDAETATASFTAPEVSMDRTLTFRLTVTDDAGAGVTSDELTVTIRQVENQLPVVDVGPALFADEGDTVYLSGLAEDPDGDIVSYLWEQTGGPDVVLSDAETATASFTAPEVSMDRTLTFRLTVTDDAGARVTSDELTVTVRQVGSAVLKVSVFGEGDLNVVGASDQLDCDAITTCEGVFDRGTDVVIEASPAADWLHDGWEGCDQVSGNQCTVSLDGDRLVSVTFLSGEPLELEDEVIVLDDDHLARIIDYDADTGLLVVEPGMPGVNDWIIGDILVSDGIDSDPGRPLAFARRITLIEDLPGEFHIHSDPASLSELFRSGSLRGSSQIQGAAVPGIAAPDSAIVLEQRDSAVFDLTYSLSDNVKVSGKLHVRVDKAELNFTANPPEFRFLLHASAKPSVAVSIGRSGTGPLKRSSGISLARTFKVPGELEFSFVIPTPLFVIPVTVRTLVFVEFRLVTNVLGIEPTATYDVSVTAGVHYKDDTDADERLESILDIQGKPSFSFGQLATGFLTGDRSLDDLELGLEAGVKLEPEALLWKTGGLVVKINPYLGAKTCVWTYVNAYRGLNLDIGGKIELPRLFRWWRNRDCIDDEKKACDSIGLDVPVVTAGPTNFATFKLRPYKGGDSPVSVRNLEIAYADIDTVSLEWSEPKHKCLDVKGYKVYRDGTKIEDITVYVLPDEDDPGEAPPTTYTDTGLKPDTEYCYQVAAVLLTGEVMMPGNEACVRTDAMYPPVGLKLEDPTPNSMVLTWVPPWNAYAVTNYVVYRHAIRFNPDDADPDDVTVVGSVAAPAEEYTVTGLQPGTEYCFSVASVYANRYTSARSIDACNETPHSPVTITYSGTCRLEYGACRRGMMRQGFSGVNDSIAHWYVTATISGPVGTIFDINFPYYGNWDLECGTWTTRRRFAGQVGVACIRGEDDSETTAVIYTGRSGGERCSYYTNEEYYETDWRIYSPAPPPHPSGVLTSMGDDYCQWTYDP